MIRDTAYELLKMSRQKKNYIPLAGYLLFLLLCYIAYKSSVSTLAQTLSSFSADRNEAAKYLDGLFFARIMLVPTFIVLMPIVMAALGGDCLAGEMQEGTLKLYMTRPRSRTGVILTKFTAVYLASFLYSLFFSSAGVIIGCLFFGTAPVQMLLMPGQVFGSTVSIMSNGEALFRYVCASLYFSFSLMTLGTMALMFSAVFNRMSAAALAVITIYFVSYIAAALPFAGVLRPWLISEIMNNAFLFWLTPFPMEKLLLNLALLAMYICGFLVAAICIFNYKDIR